MHQDNLQFEPVFSPLDRRKTWKSWGHQPGTGNSFGMRVETGGITLWSNEGGGSRSRPWLEESQIYSLQDERIEPGNDALNFKCFSFSMGFSNSQVESRSSCGVYESIVVNISNLYGRNQLKMRYFDDKTPLWIIGCIFSDIFVAVIQSMGWWTAWNNYFVCVNQEYVERFVARFWATLSDLRWGHPKWWFSKESVSPQNPQPIQVAGNCLEIKFAEMVGKSSRISVPMGIQLILEVQD